MYIYICLLIICSTTLFVNAHTHTRTRTPFMSCSHLPTYRRQTCTHLLGPEGPRSGSGSKKSNNAPDSSRGDGGGGGGAGKNKDNKGGGGGGGEGAQRGKNGTYVRWFGIVMFFFCFKSFVC